MNDSICGLHCTDCQWKVSHGCKGCIATNGNPFHGECPIAKCCLNQGYSHCGECKNLPNFCNVKDCNRTDKNGFHLCENCEKTTCGKLHAYSYTDPQHGDNPPGARIEECKKWEMLAQLHKINIPELKSIITLHLLNGDYINLECSLPNGTKLKILDDNKKYYAAQVEKTDCEKCYGVAIDEQLIAVFKYGCEGRDCELIYFSKR